LDHSFDIFIGQRPAIGAKWKLANADVDLLFFRLIFGQTYAGQLRIRIDDSRDSVVIDVTGFARDDFDARDSFVFGLVRKHRARDHIANRVDAFDIRPKVLVDLDALLVVELDADF